MSATMSATLSSPFQASMDGDGAMDGHSEPYGFDLNMSYEMPSPDLDEETSQPVVASFGPRWDSLPGNREQSMMASPRLSTMAVQQESFGHPEAPYSEHHRQQRQKDTLLQSEDKEAVLCESPPPMDQPLLEEPRVRQSVAPHPRYYSTPIREDDPSSTPVMLYGLEQPSEYAPPPRRRLPALRPVSFFGGASSSRPSSRNRNQPSLLTKPHPLQTPREPRSSMALKRLSTLLETASPTVSPSAPKAPPSEEPQATVSSTSSTLTSRSGVTLATVDSDGATASSPALSGSPASSIREPSAPTESIKVVADPSPVPTVARAATETVVVPSGNDVDIAPPPQPKPIRRKTAPDMNAPDTSSESWPLPASTKSRVPASLSSISKINFSRLPAMNHRTATRESESGGVSESSKPSQKRASSTSSSPTLAQSLQRPLPPPPLPHDYCSQVFAEIQPDDIPTHTNYDQRPVPTTTAPPRSSSSHPRGIRRVTNGDNSPVFYRPSTEQPAPSRRGREQDRQAPTTREKGSHRMSRAFSQFVNK